ncbi:GTPase domain-containing protein [Rivularia sp. UHCC 0363]|uniref:GTPase domain-containing protein n=1 Tax=Rivularia sp. UHCC 0363 TaxID=3110244 RepID=UPI002B214660|nr:GTPase domain-containing protein [Rivularia sp. UHCC 0363]MEA5594637.1 GTPase domain-containing protein [Rivularia sp. UHCC 0363]
MDVTTRIANIIEKRKPLAHKIEGVEGNLKTLSAALQRLKERRDYLSSRIGDVNVIGKLKEIDFSHIQLAIASELEALTRLKNRFSRDTLNIGVIGRARQGKSRLLQSLTGLSTAEIPDGDRQHCTGVRSTIRHRSNVDTYGEVWFHTERSFLDEVIIPYYEKLHLSAKPLTVEEFANTPLPQLPQNIPGYAEPGAMYEHLKRYHSQFEQYRHLFKEASPKVIQKHQIREYTAQDTTDGQRILFNYLAVKEVKISCTFPNTNVGKIALVDMPGLGDTGLGDENRLIQALGKDIDFVLFVRMPKSSGDYWADVDVKLYDAARSALFELPINLWSFLVLNQTSLNSSNGDNVKNCHDLLETIREKYILVEKCLITNCSDNEATNQLLEAILDYLTNQISEFDNKYSSVCQQRLVKIYESVNVALNKAKIILPQGSEDDYLETEELFSELFGNHDGGWWRDITLSLQELRTELWYQRQIPDEELHEGVIAAIESCEQDKGILSSENALEKINTRIMMSSAFRVYPDYQDELRVLISHKFLSLDQSLIRKVESVKNKVVDIFKSKGKLNNLSDTEGSCFFTEIVNFIPEKSVKLKAGFQVLGNFQLSYRGLILPRIRHHLDGLTNISPIAGQYGQMLEPVDKTLAISKDTTAEDILTALEIDYEKAINTIQPALEELLCEPGEAVYAMVEEFIDNVILQKDIQKEWKSFLRKNRGNIWSEIFGQKEQEKQMKEEWVQAVNQVTTVNKQEYFYFVQ